MFFYIKLAFGDFNYTFKITSDWDYDQRILSDILLSRKRSF